MRSILKPLLIAVSATVLLASCAKKPSGPAYSSSSQGSKGSRSACSSNPFLQRYNCSVDRVERDAEKGNADAQYTYGYMYYYGIGTIKDQDTAVYWIRKSASQGQPQAIAALDMMQAKTFPKKANTQMRSDPPPAHPKYKTVANAKSAQTKPAIKNQIAKKDNYSIQLMGSRNPEALRAFAIKEEITNASKTIETARNNQDWYVLLYGNYKSEKDAKSAIATLPNDLQTLHPWIRATDKLEHG